MQRRPSTLRTRVAFWFALAVAVLALGSAAVSALLLWRGMREEVDADLRRDVQRVVEHIELRPDGRLYLRGRYRYDGHGRKVSARFLDVLDGEGRVIHHSPRPSSRSYALPAVPRGARVELRSLRLPGGLHIRLASRVVTVAGRRVTIHMAHSEERIFVTLRQLLVILALTLPLVVAAAGVSGWWLARKALAPVDAMTALARRIHTENLTERLPPGETDDELGRLATMLNAMLVRVEQGVTRLRRFTADAAHELRTPLATLKNLGQVALQREDLGPRSRDTLVAMVEEVDRMTALVEGLLFLSRADAGRQLPHREPVALSEVADAAVDLIAVLAEEKGLSVVVDARTAAKVLGDGALLRQATLNLLHNAIKYTEPPGEIGLSVTSGNGDGRVELSVRDTGIGIDLAAHPDLFERFYRVDDARTRAAGGVGLGLAITRWIAESHGGELRVESVPGEGSRFTLSLPAA